MRYCARVLPRAVVAQLVEQLHGGPQSPAHRSGNIAMNPESRLKTNLIGSDRSVFRKEIARTTDKGIPRG
jgi:hypothetical protein